jgi:myo-inositol catabolism protein IolC
MGPAAQTWFVLACDHRRPHLATLLGLATDPGPAERATIVGAKRVIAAGFEAAVAGGVDRDSAGLLIDEEYGAEAARAAIAAGRHVALPVEASGLDRFTLADDGVVDRVVTLRPRWVKALVRYNVDGDAEANRVSRAALTDLVGRLGSRGPRLMLEVIVPPTAAQLAEAGDANGFVRVRRAALVARAMSELMEAGLAPDLWKVEGVDTLGHASLLADVAGTADRPAGLVVLGAGAPQARVDDWLRIAARTPGYVGFAVGRSLWWDEIRDLLAGRSDRDAAVAAIAANFRHAVDVYTAA